MRGREPCAGYLSGKIERILRECQAHHLRLSQEQGPKPSTLRSALSILLRKNNGGICETRCQRKQLQTAHEIKNVEMLRCSSRAHFPSIRRPRSQPSISCIWSVWSVSLFCSSDQMNRIDRKTRKTKETRETSKTRSRGAYSSEGIGRRVRIKQTGAHNAEIFGVGIERTQQNQEENNRHRVPLQHDRLGCRRLPVRGTRQAIHDVSSWNPLLTPCLSSPAILKRGRSALQHVAQLPGRILGRLLGTLEAEGEVSQGMIWREAEPPFSCVMLI